MDREAWWVTVHGIAKSQHYWATNTSLHKKIGWPPWKSGYLRYKPPKPFIVQSLSLVWLLASPSPWTLARQTPLSVKFSRQEYWSGLPVGLQGISPTQRLNSVSCVGRRILYHWATRKPTVLGILKCSLLILWFIIGSQLPCVFLAFIFRVWVQLCFCVSGMSLREHWFPQMWFRSCFHLAFVLDIILWNTVVALWSESCCFFTDFLNARFHSDYRIINLLKLVTLLCLFFFPWLHQMACGNLLPQLGIKLGLSSESTKSHHWTTRECTSINISTILRKIS